jgi:hypothetical protein
MSDRSAVDRLGDVTINWKGRGRHNKQTDLETKLWSFAMMRRLLCSIKHNNQPHKKLRTMSNEFLVNVEPKETVKQATINQTREGINLQNLLLSCVD